MDEKFIFLTASLEAGTLGTHRPTTGLGPTAGSWLGTAEGPVPDRFGTINFGWTHTLRARNTPASAPGHGPGRSNQRLFA